MEDFLNNNDAMEKAGNDYFSSIEAEQTKNYEALQNVNESDRALEKLRRFLGLSNHKIYDKIIKDGEGAGSSVNKFSGVASSVSDYLNAGNYEKYSNMTADSALNKNYVMPLDKKGLKNLKGKIADAKKITGLFDKIHEATKKYALWMIVLCALVPFAIPADRKSTRLNSSHITRSRMPSSA